MIGREAGDDRDVITLLLLILKIKGLNLNINYDNRHVCEVATITCLFVFISQRMLVTVVLLFLVTEMPQGILSMCSGLVSECFEDYYSPLGDTTDTIILSRTSRH